MPRSLDPVVTARAIVASDVIVARSAVIGVSTRFVGDTQRHDVAAVCLVCGSVLTAFAGLAVFGQPPGTTVWPLWCVAIAAAGVAAGGLLRVTAPRAATHWVVELLTVSGPVPVYWAGTAVDAERIARHLSALVPQ